MGLGVSFSQVMHAEQINDCSKSASGKNQGTLKSDGKEYSIFVFPDSESVSEAVSKFLQTANDQEPTTQLLNFEFIHIDSETIEIETQIEELLDDIFKDEISKEEAASSAHYKNQTDGKAKFLQKSQFNRSSEQKQSSSNSPSTGRSQIMYSSVFSLARAFHTSASENHQKKEGEQKGTERTRGQEERCSTILRNSNIEQKQLQETRYDREGNGKQNREKRDDEQEGFSQNQEKKNKRQFGLSDKKKKIVSINNIQASHDASSKPHGNSNNIQTQQKRDQTPLGGMESIYIRFMALMARILGQAELEAHQLYLRIKDRTDAIDVLTLLISKINSEKGAIDWSKNEEMKKLLEKVKALGVDIPEGKYTWTEDEKKLLKENIQMRKDSMEKMTQLERTDMQRYLQEASQCHQARSNVLKLLKEVIDTFIHNMRPS